MAVFFNLSLHFVLAIAFAHPKDAFDISHLQNLSFVNQTYELSGYT